MIILSSKGFKINSQPESPMFSSSIPYIFTQSEAPRMRRLERKSVALLLHYSDKFLDEIKEGENMKIYM